MANIWANVKNTIETFLRHDDTWKTIHQAWQTESKKPPMPSSIYTIYNFMEFFEVFPCARSVLAGMLLERRLIPGDIGNGWLMLLQKQPEPFTKTVRFYEYRLAHNRVDITMDIMQNFMPILSSMPTLCKPMHRINLEVRSKSDPQSATWDLLGKIQAMQLWEEFIGALTQAHMLKTLGYFAE